MILYDQNIPDSSLISYFNLTDKPSINNIILDGSLSLNDLGITSMNTFNQQTELFRLDLSSLRGSKQDKLISGVNIKTVNGQDLLGNGNVSIEVPVKSVNGMVGDVVIDVPSLIPANYITYDKLYAEDYISKDTARNFIRWEFDARQDEFVLKTDIDNTLNENSINPVQNKVVTTNINNLYNSLQQTATLLDNRITAYNSNLTERIDSEAARITWTIGEVNIVKNEIETLKGESSSSISDLEARVKAIEDEIEGVNEILENILG